MSKQAKELCASVPVELRPHAEQLAEQLLFMEKKLNETRRGLRNQAVVIPYDNGGGQEGIRRNPAFDAYNALFSSLIKALGELRTLLDVKKTDKPSGTLARFDVLAGAGKLKRDA